MIEPVSVMSEAPARAMPKSATFARPSSSTMTFCGLRSRWTIAAPVREPGRPEDLRRQVGRRAGSSAPWSRTTSLSVRPAMNSIAM